jgi:hypothetical protein
MRVPCLLLCLFAACVPADDALALGAVEFDFGVSELTAHGIPAKFTEDRWSLSFERVVLSFKTMTIGKIGVADVCAYRGRGAAADVVFDPRAGLTQTFNGILPVSCPDVGVIFGPPSGGTTLGNGVSTSELLELAGGSPAHVIVDAVAAREPLTLRIQLRLDSERTSTRFGGCREAERGIRILSHEREQVSVRFAAENLFREGISTTIGLRVQPFLQADSNRDGVATMAELDALSLRSVAGDFYQLPDGTRNGSFGDFVRALFRFSIQFRTESGLCIGNPPGADEEAPEP